MRTSHLKKLQRDLDNICMQELGVSADDAFGSEKAYEAPADLIKRLMALRLPISTEMNRRHRKAHAAAAARRQALWEAGEAERAARQKKLARQHRLEAERQRIAAEQEAEQRRIQAEKARADYEIAHERRQRERAEFVRWAAQERLAIIERHGVQQEAGLEDALRAGLTRRSLTKVESGNRGLRALHLHRRGLSFREIGIMMGGITTSDPICPQQVRQIVEKAKGIEARRAKLPAPCQRIFRRATLTRPVDMGGPRGEWQVWTPEMQAAEFAPRG